VFVRSILSTAPAERSFSWAARAMSSPGTEFAYAPGVELRVLAPPWKAAVALDFRAGCLEPPPGAIVFGKGTNTLAVLAGLTAAVHRWPWAVPCVAISLDDGSLEPLLMLVSDLRDCLGVVKQVGRSTVGEVSGILAAVRNRKEPDADVLSNWVGRRLDNAALRDAVARQFRQALGGLSASGTASAATYSRLFKRFGLYTARDWRAIARTCRHYAAIGSIGTTGVLPIRAVRHYLKKYLHLSYHTAAERVGWEWVLEGALRAGRYVEARP
jgi:hypothetical protein